MEVPSLREIEALHRKYAPHDEAFRSIYTHCQIIAEIAGELMDRGVPGIERDVVHAGCLLHDIGVYKLYENGVLDEKRYVAHGVLGEELLRSEGYPERMCRFCSHHTGVGISKEQVVSRNLPMPPADYFADTEEERLIMYADKFHSKIPDHFNTAPSYKQTVAKFGAEMPGLFQNMIDKYGVPDLESLAKKYGHPVQ